MNTTTPMGMLQQPRPFFMIFFVELWERFGYYGVQGVLAVFFVKQLGFSQEQAFVTFGAFAALVYGLISWGLSLSVTACLKLTQPACFRSAIRRKIRGLMAHLPCSICRSTSAR